MYFSLRVPDYPAAWNSQTGRESLLSSRFNYNYLMFIKIHVHVHCHEVWFFLSHMYFYRINLIYLDVFFCQL